MISQSTWNFKRLSLGYDWLSGCIRIAFLITMIFTMLFIAWVGDDALITFKQVWNFINGEGITFNYDTRVQAFTHPLWFFFLSILTFFTREYFLTTIAASLTLSMLAIYLLLLAEAKVKGGKHDIFTPLIFLLFSWAFCEFTSSGLEYPLAYLLIGMLLYFVSKGDVKEHVKKCFVILALLVLTRFDYAFLFLPFAVALLLDCGNIRNVVFAILPGAVLLVLWHLFATFYFGTPLPNTYYAKLLGGIPIEEYRENGLKYFVSMKYDISSMLIIAAGIFISLICKNKYLISLGIGQIFYLYYIYNSGGDFMLGRLFSTLVFLSVGCMIVSKTSLRIMGLKTYNRILMVLFVIFVFMSLNSRLPTLAAWYTDFRGEFNLNGPIDERFFYLPEYGLFYNKSRDWPNIYMQTGTKPEKFRIRCGGIGRFSLTNPEIFPIDHCALVDPFLVRIPAIRYKNWRTGHIFRKIPTNYGEYSLGDKDMLVDKRLIELFGDIELLVRGNLLSFDRFQAIKKINFGYDYGIDWTNYTNPNTWMPSTLNFDHDIVDNWNNPVIGMRWIDPTQGILRNEYWAITSKTPKHATRILVDIINFYDYEVYVNEELIANITGGINCESGLLINLSREYPVETIKFKAVSIIQGRHQIGTRVKHLKILDGNENIPELEPECLVSGL